MMIVDFHSHYYPPAYIDALRSGRSSVRVTLDDDGNPWLHYPGDYNIAVRGHRDIDYRAEVLEGYGVDTQVITLTTPGTHVEIPATAARLASLVNDAFATAVHDMKGRFYALATLPLNDPAASVRELERAVTGLGLPGAMLFSNVNGVALADERYNPLYEVANSPDGVLHIHPTNPVGVESDDGLLADATGWFSVRYHARRGKTGVCWRAREISPHSLGTESSGRSDSVHRGAARSGFSCFSRMPCQHCSATERVSEAILL